MHLLETDASNRSVQWFMDSQMVRKGDEKSRMIKTPSRIDANLQPHIGDVMVAGNRFSAPHCRAFTKVTTGFPLDVEYRRRKATPEPSPENRQSPEKERTGSEEPDPEGRDREVPSSPPDGDATRFHPGPRNREANLNGFINGFIVQTSPDGKEPSPHEAHPPSTFRGIKMENSGFVNNNSNNNRLPSAAKYNEKWSKMENENRRKSAEFHRAREYLEYMRPDDDIDGRDENTALNGSDILRRMYASFGSRPSDASRRRLAPSFGYNPEKTNVALHDRRQKCHDTGKPRMKSPTEKQRLETATHENGDGKRHLHDSESGIKFYPAPTSPTCPSFQPKDQHTDDLGSRVSPHSRNPQNHGEVQREKNTNGHENRPRTPDDISRKNHPKRTSPIHSIDSLLSNRHETSNFASANNSRERHHSKNDTPATHPVKQAFIEAPNSHRRKREASGECHSRISNSEPRNLTQSPKRGHVIERDVYNEKSREIFRQDKEIIENSIRPNPQLPYGIHPQDASLHSPPWQNTSAMAALQANLLSSFPQNGGAALGDPSLFLKSASLAAAASANSLFLGVNPYLLRGLGSSEVAAAAAYHQAMAQGLLQSHPAINPLLNSSVMGVPGVHPGMNPFICGLGDTSPLAAAIAASMRNNAAGLYPSTNFPYATLPPHLGPMDNSRVPQFGLDKPGTSPNQSPLSPKRLGREIGPNEHGPAKQRRESGDTKANFVTRPREDPVRRASREYLANPARSRTLLGEKLIAPQNPPKPYVPPTPTLPFGQKRKLSPPLSSNVSTPKKKSCNMRIDSGYNKKPTVKDFSPNSLLKPPKDNKNGDLSKSSAIPNEKIPKSSDKVSSSRPSSYKNLTRERRLVANARERTRVHTISSAFEELRHQIPSYSCNQKLSKLAILRIACSYIQSLSVLSGRSEDGTFKDSVDQCTRVLQAESRARSRRKNNKAQIEWEVANYEKSPSYDVEVKRKADVSRRSPGTSPSALHNVSTANSPRREEIAQVPGENDYRKLLSDDSPRSQSDSLGDIAHHLVNSTRSDDSTEPGDQSRPNLIEERAMTEHDSLDANAEQIKASRVNVADGGGREHHKYSPRGENSPQSNTWHTDARTRLENQAISLSPTDCETERSPEQIPDDQQNDLINVED